MTMSARQTTTMKYGLRMEKRDMKQFPDCAYCWIACLVLLDLHHLRLHLHAGFQTAAVADHDAIALVQAAQHLGLVGGLRGRVAIFRSCSVLLASTR